MLTLAFGNAGRVAVSVPGRQTVLQLCRLHLGTWGLIWGCHTLITRGWEYLVKINSFSPAPTRPMEVTAGGIHLPFAAWGVRGMGSLILKNLSKKSSAMPASSMRADEERPKRPKAPLPASMLGKATDFLAFKLLRGFEIFVCELLEFQGNLRISTCLMDAKSRCRYIPQIKRNWFGGNSELHSQKYKTST